MFLCELAKRPEAVKDGLIVRSTCHTELKKIVIPIQVLSSFKFPCRLGFIITSKVCGRLISCKGRIRNSPGGGYGFVLTIHSDWINSLIVYQEVVAVHLDGADSPPKKATLLRLLNGLWPEAKETSKLLLFP